MNGGERGKPYLQRGIGIGTYKTGTKNAIDDYIKSVREKYDTLELQKYPAPSSGAILQSFKNDGFVLPNTYHKIESSCIHKEDAAHILFKVDGKTVLDYVDTDNPNLKVGYFSKQANSGVYMKSSK